MSKNQDLLDEVQKYLGWKKSKSFVAEKVGITLEELEILLKDIRGKDEEPEESVKKVNNDKGTIESSIEVSFEPKDDISLAKLHKIDLSKYKISSYWSKLKSNGKFTSSVFATLKRPQDYTPEDFTKFLSNWQPSINLFNRIWDKSSSKETVDVELNIADFHLAKKTIKGDSLTSKEFEYLQVVNDLVSKIRSNYTIRKLVFPISNDFFHSDNIQNTTTNGTPQDVTVWYDEEYEKGFDILANTINYLLTQANEIEVVLVQGNHDRTKGFYVAHALEVFFKGYKKVKFQRHHSTTKSVVLGNTFIGYHHGNSCKIDELPLLFATVPDFSKEFGNAKYREIHTGDKHHYMAKDIKGVRIQQLPSLSGDDRWHIDNNFINSVRAGIAFVYDPIKGKVAEFESRV
jgi:hypothetical protein